MGFGNPRTRALAVQHGRAPRQPQMGRLVRPSSLLLGSPSRRPVHLGARAPTPAALRARDALEPFAARSAVLGLRGRYRLRDVRAHVFSLRRDR